MSDVVDVTITLATKSIDDPAWRREWTINYLRGEGVRHGETAGRDYPERGKWTMSREDIVRLLAVFEASGATPEGAERMTWFLPEAFCRMCLDAGGIHRGVTPDGKEFWVAGTAEAMRKWLAEAMEDAAELVEDADA